MTKPNYSLLPWAALRDVAQLMTDMQAGKYAEPQWTKRGKLSHVDSALRHLGEHLLGDEYDPESQHPTLVHACARLLMAVAVGNADPPDKPDQ